MSEPVRYEVSKGVATITLDAPERRNAFSQDLVKALLAGLTKAGQDTSVRVVVVTNTGGTFSAGADLKEDRAALGPDAATFVDVVRVIEALPKPVVAKVAGHAAGGGAALAACCDLAIATTAARIGITEVRIGVPPHGVAALLARRMTKRSLFEAFLVADMMPAVRAAELGLINLAVAPEDFEATVARYVDALLRGGPHSLAATKRLLLHMDELSPEQAELLANEASRGAFDRAEAKEGVASFIAKRPAAWIPADS